MKEWENFDLNYNFECDRLIELSNNKLSNDNLASDLVENRSFFKAIIIKGILTFMIRHIRLIFINLHLQTDFSIKGDLEIGFESEEPETLIVTIHKAFNIKTGNTLRNTTNTFVKCAISGT